MTRIKLRHIDRFRDRNGHLRYYFRRGHNRRIPLPGLPGSAEFMSAYELALAGAEQQEESRKERGAPGTFDRLTQVYFQSSDYARLAPSTQRAYRLVIERLVVDENIGHRLVRQFRREHVSRMVAKRSGTPGAANDVLKKLRILLRFAIANGWLREDPTLRVKGFAEGTFHTWTDGEIEAFERRWPIGTRERTAFALLLFTGQRVSDVRRMSWRDLDGPGIQIVQGKTGSRLWIPLHSNLCTALDQWPRSHISILTTTLGRPFTAKGLGNWMADKIGEAGLPDRCVTHGLRKAAARRLAEAGCTTHEIMAITGHQSLKEVERYTRTVEQRKLAASAIDQLGRAARSDNA